jgi:hypothetical protein
MPPTRPVVPRPSSPVLEPFPPLSKEEEELFDIAIRLDSALREFDGGRGAVDTRFYVQAIMQELVSLSIIIGTLLKLTTHVQTDTERICTTSLIPGGPRMHPIIEHVGAEVAEAGKARKGLDLHTLKLGTVEEWCDESAENCPTETGVIHIPDLRPFTHRVPTEFRWWLPPALQDDPEDTGKIRHRVHTVLTIYVVQKWPLLLLPHPHPHAPPFPHVLPI